MVSQCFVCPENNLLNVCLRDFSLRYSIDRRSEAAKVFRIEPNNGTISVTKALDRETSDCHNLTVEAKEICKDNLFFLFTKTFDYHLRLVMKAVQDLLTMCSCQIFVYNSNSQPEAAGYHMERFFSNLIHLKKQKL